MREQGRGQSGPTGPDGTGSRSDAIPGFYGRAEELAWLRGLFEQAAGRAGDGSTCPPSPRLAVIVADTGLGKTRLVQALYQQLTEDPHWDPAGVDYWPPAFQEAGKSLAVNPETKGHVAHGPPRFLWLGMRGRDPSDRNSVAGYTALSMAREALLAHVEIAKRHQGAWAIVKDRAAKGWKKEGLGELAGAAVETVVPFAGLFAKLARGVAAATHDLGDPIDSVGDRIEKQRKDLVEEMLEMLLEVLKRGGVGGRPLPVILWMDDAQWIDPDSLRLVHALWRTATDRRDLPLFIVCTHWERDWRLREQELRDAGGELPIGATSLAEMVRRDGGEARVLRKAEWGDLGAYLDTQLPGLTARQRDLVLAKSDGNFLTMVENVGELLAEPMHFDDDDIRGPLTSVGEEEVVRWELRREDRVAQIFKKLDKRIKESLGWSSRLGMRFLHEVVEEFAAMQAAAGSASGASGDGKIHPASGESAARSHSGLDECVDPHAILDVPSPFLRVFRDRAWHLAASKHFEVRARTTPQLLIDLDGVLKRHLVEWVNNSFNEEGDLITAGGTGDAPDATEASNSVGTAAGVDRPEPNLPGDANPVAPARAAVLLDSAEQRDLLGMAVTVLPLCDTPDWIRPEDRAALRARLLAIWNDAEERMWDRVLVDARSLATVAWSKVPTEIVSTLLREQAASIIQDAGAFDAAMPLREEALARSRREAAGTDSAALRRAVVLSLHRLGELTRLQGDLLRARAIFEEALAITLAYSPSTSGSWAKRDAWVALDKLGDLAVLSQDVVGAAARFAESLTIGRALGAPGELASRRRGLAVSLGKCGDVAILEGNAEEAERLFWEALGIARELCDMRPSPEHRHDVAVCVSKLGDIAIGKGDADRAEVLYRESLTIARELAIEVQTPAGVRELAVSIGKVADVAMAHCDLVSADAMLAESLDLVEDLSGTLGGDLMLQERVVLLVKRSQVAVRQGQWSTAVQLSRAALRHQRRLVVSSDDPLQQWIEDYILMLTRCRMLARASGDAHGCLSYAIERLNIAQSIARQDNSLKGSEALLTHVMPVLWSYIELGQVGEAVAWAGQAVEVLDRLEAAFDDPAIDNVEQQLDATTLERCAEAWALAARAAEECENDAGKAAECRARAAALRDRIAAMKAASGDGGSGGASEGD